MPFGVAAELQERLRAEIAAEARPDTLLVCEHDPVITLGRKARPEHVLASPAELASRGIAVAQASRGGDVTYHGPGQLVAYPVFRLRRGVLAHVEGMAAAVIDVLGGLGIEGRWRRETPGVWVGDAKICAMGVHVSRRVAVHGLALNLTTDLSAFASIVPCGLAGAKVTSVAALGVTVPDVGSVVRALVSAFERRFDLALGPLLTLSGETDDELSRSAESSWTTPVRRH